MFASLSRYTHRWIDHGNGETAPLVEKQKVLRLEVSVHDVVPVAERDLCVHVSVRACARARARVCVYVGVGVGVCVCACVCT